MKISKELVKTFEGRYTSALKRSRGARSLKLLTLKESRKSMKVTNKTRTKQLMNQKDVYLWHTKRINRTIHFAHRFGQRLKDAKHGIQDEYSTGVYALTDYIQKLSKYKRTVTVEAVRIVRLKVFENVVLKWNNHHIQL